MFKKICLTVSNFGIESGSSSADDRRLRITNQFILLAIIFTVIYSLLCHYWHLKNATTLEAFFSIVYFCLLMTSRLGFPRIARNSFMVAINIQMFFLSLCFGRASQIYLVYIPVAAVPLVLYSLRPAAKIILFSILTLALLVTLFVIDFSSPFLDHISFDPDKYLSLSCIMLSIICEVIVICSFIISTGQTERTLDDDNLFLQIQLKAIFDNSQDGLFLVDGTSKQIMKANKRAVEIFEMESEESFFGLYGNDLHKEEMTAFELNDFLTSLREKQIYESEVLYKTKKGNVFWGALAVRVITINGKQFHSVRVADISVQKKSQQATKAALLEKEVLLAEIHHRVKNNMAVISGLLGISSNYVEDEKAKMVFEESRNRIHTMAMIHEKLYSHETLSKIEFKTYIHDLISHIKSSYSKASTKINFSVACTDIFLDIKSALPCGLILNELITNAYKHAFAGMEHGEINITCMHSGNDFTMHVSDNGIGFDMKALLDKPKTLGLTLISALTEQLSGELNISAGQGTSYAISFKI